MKFDLCKAFGVEEGQEFGIIKMDLNACCVYKIENGELKFKMGLEGTVWEKSVLSFSDIEDAEIEILPIKKSIPENVREVLEKCKQLGCVNFYFCDYNMTWLADELYTEAIFYSQHYLFFWAEENLNKDKIYTIDDILSGNF